MNEIWLPVVGYEGLYEVSNKGRIKTLWHVRGKRWAHLGLVGSAA